MAEDTLNISIHMKGKILVENGVIKSNRVKVFSEGAQVVNFVPANILGKLEIKFKSHEFTTEVDSSNEYQIYIERNKVLFKKCGFIGFIRLLMFKLNCRGYTVTIYSNNSGTKIKLFKGKCKEQQTVDGLGGQTIGRQN